MIRFLWSILVLMIGFACTAAAYWTLLNVPESNVLALVLSALLVLLVILTAGVSIAMSIAKADGMTVREAAKRSTAALPLFVLGLVALGVLWLATTTFDTWWAMHRGEVDASVMRYTGITHTYPLHTTVSWITWLLRWGFGLSLVAGLVAIATLRDTAATGEGLRLAVRPVPLAATIAGLLATSQGLWRATSWRPESLPATGAEIYFSGAKLGVLYVLGATIAAAVLAVFRHNVRRGRNLQVTIDN